MKNYVETVRLLYFLTYPLKKMQETDQESMLYMSLQLNC
jgi:hypothetical protein